MFISPTAKSVVWLLRNDPKGWTIGHYSMGHAAAGIGIWTSNGPWFCNPFYKVPAYDIKNCEGHILGGREVSVSVFDKFYIWLNTKKKAKNGEIIPRIISEFATHKLDQQELAQ